MKHSLSIATCKRCCALAQSKEANHQNGEERLPAYLELETICFESHSDEHDEVHDSETVVRCPDCRTFYLSEWHKDEGHSFMDPTSDETKDRRLTLTEALHQLSRKEHWQSDKGIAAACAEILSTREGVVGGLQTLLLEERAPNGEVLQHAVASVVEGALEHGDLDAIRTGVLRAADPVVRAESIYWLAYLALERHWAGGSPAVRDRALEYLDAEDTARMLVGELVEILRQRAKPIPDNWKKTTHKSATYSLGKLAGIRKPFHPEVLDALLALLQDEDGEIAKAALEALRGTEWVDYGRSTAALSEQFAAWSKKHPGNAHGRALAREFASAVERRAKK